MTARPRIYDAMLAGHLRRWRQMAFVSGPRQVGKTTTCRRLGDAYFNLDDPADRAAIMGSPAALTARLGLDKVRKRKAVVVLDELHRWKKWKRFLKGFFDRREAHVRIIVTGSARLDVYRRGSDSLLGRYFPYRMHPFSIGEIARRRPPDSIPPPPVPVPRADASALWEFGGFPEPFLRRDRRHFSRWQTARTQVVLREELRDLTRVEEIAQMEAFARLLAGRSSARLVYSHVAGELSVPVSTAIRWTSTLVALHQGFLLRPWHRKIARSLRKEPKWYLRDWSTVSDPGARAETYLACHLLKAVDGWTDLGLGTFGLWYLRDKAGREVDFLVTRDDQPWFLVEAKLSDGPLSPALAYFQAKTGARHAFQVAVQAPWVAANPFERTDPVKVPALTFLSQLP